MTCSPLALKMLSLGRGGVGCLLLDGRGCSLKWKGLRLGEETDKILGGR